MKYYVCGCKDRYKAGGSASFLPPHWTNKPPFLSNERVSGYKTRGIVPSWEKDEKINYLLMSIRMISVQKLREKLLADSAYTAAFYHSFADIDFLRTFRPGNS